MGCRIKCCLRPAEIGSFSCRDLSRGNKHDLFTLVVLGRYLYIWFLWAIVVSDFLPFEIDKHLSAESIALLIFVLWHCFNSRWIVGWGIKFDLGPAERIALLIFALWLCFSSPWIVCLGKISDLGRAEIASFSFRDLSRPNKSDLLWLVVSARYLHLLFLWAIVFSDFLPLEIHKHLRAESIALLISVFWHSFNSRWIVDWSIKSYLGAAESLALLIFVLWHCFKSRWIVGVSIKPYSGPAEIASLSFRDLIRRNRQDLFWLVVSARSLYIVFLKAIVVWLFLSLEIHKHLRAESIALSIFVLWHCFNTRWIVGWNIKFYLGPAKIASFSCRGLSRHNTDDLFWLVVSARYLYILFLWAIVVSDFLPFEIHKHLRAESIALLIFLLWHCFNSRWIVY